MKCRATRVAENYIDLNEGAGGVGDRRSLKFTWLLKLKKERGKICCGILNLYCKRQIKLECLKLFKSVVSF